MEKICIDCKCVIRVDEIVKFTPRCLNCRRTRNQIWRDKNRKQYNEYFRKYRKSEKGKQIYSKLRNDIIFRKRNNLNNLHRYHNDINYKLCCNCRTIINSIFKKRKFPKSFKTIELLGTDNFFVIKEHIESLFKDGMSWDNHGRGEGKWNFDHIIPLASAKNIDELKRLMHYKNLQPLWAVENSTKGSLLDGVRYRHLTSKS